MGKKELEFPSLSSKSNKIRLREQSARKILRSVRAQGHPYVELREDNNACIYFCVLCLARCFNDGVLYDHLRGNIHRERALTAQLTMIKPNPWPFNDGMAFFHTFGEDDTPPGATGGGPKLLEEEKGDESLAIVEYKGKTKQLGPRQDSNDTDSSNNQGKYDFLIPKVLIKEDVSDLMIRYIGRGKIASRYMEKKDGSSSIVKTWCEWLGKQTDEDDTFEVPKHDFAIVVFSYSYELGRKGVFEDIRLLLEASAKTDPKKGEAANKKRKKCSSDPEDESLSLQFDPSGEEYITSSRRISRSALNKRIRRELRRQQGLAAEKLCDICQQKMFPGKNMATLLNLKTGKLACSSKNSTGAFHVFHISCLIHWILLCEYEIATNPPPVPPARKKSGAKRNQKNTVPVVRLTGIDSVFCPECQGTAYHMDGNSMEPGKGTLHEMFEFKLKIAIARKAWFKDPEALKNCSIGFCFPDDSKDIFQEKVMPLKLLDFYGAINCGSSNVSSEFFE